MEMLLEQAMAQIEKSAVVVSGPAGSGKTELIKKTAQKAGHILVEIDGIEEYKTHRLNKRIVYLLRTSEGMRISSAEYAGIIFETDNPYFFRKIKNSTHIKNTMPTLRAIKKHCASVRSRMSMHRVLNAAKMPKETHSVLLENSADSISLFHVLGKILYHKTENVPEEVMDTIENNPFKVLLYVHENIPTFVTGIGELARVLDQISLTSTNLSLIHGLITAIWKLEKHSPKKFYHIRPSPYNIE